MAISTTPCTEPIQGLPQGVLGPTLFLWLLVSRLEHGDEGPKLWVVFIPALAPDRHTGPRDPLMANGDKVQHGPPRSGRSSF